MLWCNPRDRLLLPDHTDSLVDLQNLLVTLVCINLYGNFQSDRNNFSRHRLFSPTRSAQSFAINIEV